MALSGTDILMYGSAFMPESGGVVAGSGIDLTTRVVFDDATLANTLNDEVSVVSTQSIDIKPIVITGRDSGGVIVSETINTNGTIPVTGTQIFERLLKIVATQGHSGTISLKRADNTSGIATLESGVNTIRRPFYDVAADAAGGSTRNFYEKLFLKNKSTSNALLNAIIIESSDPSSKITFAISSGVNDILTVTNRETQPTANVTSFSSSGKVPSGGVINTGNAIGIWLNLTLSAGDAPAKTTYTLQASGTTT
jgi:hypothetical protein